MLRKTIILLLALVLNGAGARASEWTNLTPDRRLGGRMVSAGYLRGKVVLLDCRNYGDKKNFEAIRALQQTWASYKSKPFVIVGSHRGPQSPELMGKILDRLGVTYPVYADANLGGLSDPGEGPKIYVLDSTGTTRLYSGSEVKMASGVLGTAIFSAIRPSAARQWKRLLDYEIANLPGQAYLRLKSLQADGESLSDLRNTFPDDVHRYIEAYKRFKDDAEVKRLAKLVEIARLVKDRDTESRSGQKVTKAGIDRHIEKYESLKESDNPFVAQEAKNAIADLMFVKATLKK